MARPRPGGRGLLDGLSALFPQGERFFIESVRAHRRLAEGVLARDVAQLIAQEAVHTREHVAFNAQAAAAGRDMGPLEARTGCEIAAVRRKGDLRKLGATVALEHFTALLAHELVAEPAHLRDAPTETRGLWLWRAAEEIEHKAVATPPGQAPRKARPAAPPTRPAPASRGVRPGVSARGAGRRAATAARRLRRPGAAGPRRRSAPATAGLACEGRSRSPRSPVRGARRGRAPPAGRTTRPRSARTRAAPAV
ncbi:metal-dependent hydrolase [Phenylobacterium sp.]|uniref:metal-dependent hydrolase n=1 Tax=Phenylobacterium sp. TaxID=1871053 RepID=UPI0035B46E1D